MKKRKKSVKKRAVEKRYSRRGFAAKLRRLADAVECGEPFTIRVAGQTVRAPAGTVLSVEHEREGGREELEFQLRWTRS